MDGFLPTVPFYCIHLHRIHARLPLIQTLEERMRRPITIFEASDGKDVATYGWPKRHPFSSSEITNGILGCLDSHIRLLVNMIQSNYDIIGIFEDDDELSMIATVLWKYLGNGQPQPIFGPVFLYNESSESMIDMTIEDIQYIMAHIPMPLCLAHVFK
jgi:hypothetical protein